MVLRLSRSYFCGRVIDTSFKGSIYLHSFGLEYPIRIGVGPVVCLIGILVRNRRIQLTLLAVSLIYQISFIVLLYNRE